MLAKIPEVKTLKKIVKAVIVSNNHYY